MIYFFIYTFLTLNFLNVYCQSIEELSAEIYRDSSFIFNDSVKKIFKGDVIYLIDFDEKNKIYKNVRCIVCQGQSIYDSDTDFAIDLKKLISKKLENGENELRCKYCQRHGRVALLQ